MSRHLRKQAEQLPWFLLYNYPKKLKAYNAIMEKNKKIENPLHRYKTNAYHSPSPMNELCDYICTWEKKNILWSHHNEDLVNTRCLIVDSSLDLNDRMISRKCRRAINEYADALKQHIARRKESNSVEDNTIDLLIQSTKDKLLENTGLDERTLANYVIQTSYASMSISKAFAWAGYGDYIIENLKANSNPKKAMVIREVPYRTADTYEYLGKFYEFEVGGQDV